MRVNIALVQVSVLAISFDVNGEYDEIIQGSDCVMLPH